MQGAADVKLFYNPNEITINIILDKSDRIDKPKKNPE
jgi:hypothetical protein